RAMEIQKRRAEASRQAFYRWTAMLNEGGRALLDGRFDDAEGLFRQALEAADDVQLTPPVMTLGGAGAIQLEHQGRVQDMLSNLASVVAAFPQVPIWRAGMARWRVVIGETEAARRDLEALAVNGFRDIPRNLGWLFILCHLSDVVWFFGDTERA